MNWQNFFSSSITDFKSLMEVLSYVATTIGVLVIIVTVKTYRMSVEQKNQEHLLQSEAAKEKRIQNSIRVLKAFSSTIIPKMEEMEDKAKGEFTQKNKEVLDSYNEKREYEGKNKVKTLPPTVRESVIVWSDTTAGISAILNELEHVSVYINYELVELDLIYPTLHDVFLNFLSQHRLAFNKLANEEHIYRGIKLWQTDWEKKKQLESLDKEEQILQDKRHNLLDDKEE